MGAKFSKVKVGHFLVTDDGFTCMKAGERKQVFADDKGLRYVKCDRGKHYLNGQVGKDDKLAGLDFEK